MPQAADGKRIEPPVSVPSEAKQSPAAVATPDPLDEAPGQRLDPQGFCGTGRSGWYQAIANSVRLSLPTRIAPAASRRSTTVAFGSGFQSRSKRLAQVVATPAVWQRSFTATGTPWSGPRQRSARISRSASAARAIARSASTAR